LALLTRGDIVARLGFAQSVEPEPVGVHHAPHPDVAMSRANPLVVQFLTLLRRKGPQPVSNASLARCP
jgi:hypothetical protein